VVWGKIHNAGQVCIAPNHILIHPSKEQEFVESFIQSVNSYLPNGAIGSPDMASIIEKRSFHRIKDLLEKSNGTILYGGNTDEATKFIEPTLVKVTDPNDALLSEEIFGPVIALLVVERVDEMLSLAKRIGDTPLGMYIFSGDKAEQEYSELFLETL
jgi:beta-apo-4'-carotenal oxygenase